MFGAGTAPDAVLNTQHISQPKPGDMVGSTSAEAIQFADITGDGYLDVVVGAKSANANNVVDSGAIYVFRGEQDLVNMSGSPELELTVQSAGISDRLGDGTGETIQFADLSGDGVLDVIASAEHASSGDGRIYVWEEVDSQTGLVFAAAELRGSHTNERLGHMSGQGVFAVDITADGILDIVSGSSLTDDGALVDMGSLYIWDGVNGFSNGLVSPNQSFYPTVTTGVAYRMGDLTGPGLQFFDVNGDFKLDMIGGSSYTSEVGVEGAGMVFIWTGGSNVQQSGLFFNGAELHDNLCRGGGQGIRIHDVTGDGTLDLIVSAEFADHQGVADVGAFHLWEGGPSLPFSTPFQTLRLPNPVAGDRLGATSGPSVLFADLDGDLVDDLVLGARYVDYGAVNTGAYYFFKGASGLTGERFPDSNLITQSPQFGDQLGGGSFGMQAFDMTGDGFLDLLIGAAFADEGQVVNSGALYLWTGGAQAWEAADTIADEVLADPAASTGDMLGG